MTHSISKTLSACIALIGSLGAASNASASLFVDFTAGPDANPEQSGYVSFITVADSSTVLQTVSYSATEEEADGSGVSVTLASSNAFARDYGAIVGGPFAAQSNLLSDFIGVASAAGTISIELGNLNAGIYELTTYHHTTQFNGATFDAFLTDSDVSNSQIATALNTSTSNTPLSITTLTTNFSVASLGGSATVVFNVTAGASDIFAINGFDLQLIQNTGASGNVPVPVPTVLLISGLLALRHRRRQQQMKATPPD